MSMSELASRMAGVRGIRGIFLRRARNEFLCASSNIEPRPLGDVVLISWPDKNPTQGRALVWQGYVEYRYILQAFSVQAPARALDYRTTRFALRGSTPSTKQE